MQMLDRFAAVIATGSQRLAAISGADAAQRREPDAWSGKEELGHLIDSAINNYARVIRAQHQDKPELPGYAQDIWVERGGYQERDWKELIALWSAVNTQMLHAARRVPPAALSRECKIGDGPVLTLGFVIEDYVDHMVHHLGHIGIAVSEFRRAESAYA
jgi:DinB superfamily